MGSSFVPLSQERRLLVAGVDLSLKFKVFAAGGEEVPGKGTVALRRLEDEDGLINVVADGMAEADFRADPPSGNSKRPIARRGYHATVPNVVAGLPLPFLVDQIRVHALELHQGRESPRHVQADDPAQTIRLLGEVSDFEGSFLASFELDFRADGVLSDFLTVDDLAVDFHYVVGRSSISGPELVHARFFDLNESASDLSTSTG